MARAITLYRHCDPRHTELPETLKANKQQGGRFNPRGIFGAVYAAFDRETAIRELFRYSELTGVPLGEFDPRILLTLLAHLRRVLDLTDSETRKEWGLSESATEDIPWHVCQQIGSVARQSGFEAVIFTAAVGTGKAIAIFADNLHPGSHLNTIVAEEFSPVQEHRDSIGKNKDR